MTFQLNCRVASPYIPCLEAPAWPACSFLAELVISADLQIGQKVLQGWGSLIAEGLAGRRGAEINGRRRKNFVAKRG